MLLSIGETFSNLAQQTAFASLDWKNYVMIVVACIFLYLAIAKGFEPLLLTPIAFGMLLVNIYPQIIGAPTTSYLDPKGNELAVVEFDGESLYAAMNVAGDVEYLENEAHIIDASGVTVATIKIGGNAKESLEAMGAPEEATSRNVVSLLYYLLQNEAYTTKENAGGLLHYFYILDEWAILPCLIFMGVGAMTDFAPPASISAA